MGASAQCPTRRYCVSGNWHRVEARVQRLKWAQSLVQDPAHHTQLTTAMFGKLPSEPNPTLGPGGEISPEANPCAMKWMADLDELEPYDERELFSVWVRT